MHIPQFVACALALAIPALAICNYEVFESLVEPPEGWVQASTHIDLQRMIWIRIQLVQQNVGDFENRLLDMSDPDSRNYGKHMSSDQIRMMLAPHEDTTSAVMNWLQEKGLAERAVVKHDSVKLRLTVAEAEDLLQADYKLYQNQETGQEVLRTLEYSVPEDVKKHISLVQPTTMFGLRQMTSHVREVEGAPKSLMEKDESRVNFKTEAKGLNLAACNTTITPTCLAELYGFAGYNPSGRGAIGISGFLEQYAQNQDLKLFLREYAPEAAKGNFTFVSVNGGKNTQNPPNEDTVPNLNVQYSVSITYPIKNTFFQTGGRPPFTPDLEEVSNDSEPYLEYLDYLLDQKSLPDVITTSYGEAEQTVPYKYQVATCNKMAQLGARGVSLIFSSGDTGPGASCRSNDGKGTTKFLPMFPATCPWVTAVGGTVHVEPEQAVNFSSGGFSETWPRPAYQDNAVGAFFNGHPSSWKPWENFFHKSGRGFPDVSIQASNFSMILEESELLVGGTSASAPAFSGIIALVNDYRLKNGKKALGFLNPLLYKNPQAFTDIKAGRSMGCDGTYYLDPIPGNPAIIPGAGWDAVEGWDPASGLGTPKFEALKML
jgi:tripeptidyl-peptidase-1